MTDQADPSIDAEQLLAIPGIDTNQVERHGNRLLRLVRDAHCRYKQMRAEQARFNKQTSHDGCHGPINSIGSSDSEGETSKYFAAAR